ncbi:MAG: hypothetical protein PWR13_125 [Archaeoglobi archaeon]|nr:hypothetical protein [Candidatus Mnemosynella bozhongmuii]MDI3502098.1 hypothetical protein [Archaeoglobi archaeon]MDK2781097.1 hypothetical protein [Archaeoglobi archaeon]
MRTQESLEEVLRLIEDLRERSLEGETIIVEGERDRRSLRRLGIEGKIICSSQLSINSLLELIEEKRIIILTDWDEHGIERGRYLLKHLSSLGFKCDMELHRKFSALLKKEIKDIESLEKYVIKYANIYKSGKSRNYR